MKSLFLLSAFAAIVGTALPNGAKQVVSAIKEADSLYARREDAASARRSAEMLADAVRRDPSDFEAAWRLGRIRLWIGDHSAERERRGQYELGAQAARLAVAARPDRPHGHFWLGMNLGGLADLGMFAGIKYHDAVRREFEESARLDPGFEAGSAWTALGAWYLRVPGFMGGDAHKAEELLRRALTYDPDGTVNHYFLAETLVSLNRKEEARLEFQKVIDAPFSPDATPEDKEWKRKARDAAAALGKPR